MKTSYVISLCFALVCSIFSHCVFSQDQDSEMDLGRKIGLGASLFNVTEYSYEFQFNPSNTIFLTVDFDEKIRIEPTLSFVIADEDDYFSFGIGAFRRHILSKFNILYGGRIGIGTNDTYSFAPTIGAEYYFIRNFSLGTEMQIRAIRSESDWYLITQTSAIIRFYW